MTEPVDPRTWRNRFVILNLVRIGGTAVALFGLALWQTDVVVEGGAPAIGFALAIAGLMVSFGGPHWLARYWRKPPGA